MRTLTPDEARAVYDRVGARQDAQGWYEDAAVDALVAHGAFSTARSVVEVGCGTGRLAARLFAGALPPNATVLASDPSPVMRALAADRLAPFGDRARVVDAVGMPDVAPGSADRVVSAYLVDLLSESDARRLVAAAHAALVPGGRLALTSLTEGVGPVSRAVTVGWRAVHRVRPAWVGGCRPVRLGPLVEGSEWSVVHRSVVTPWGVPSEAVVAVRA